MNLGRKLRKLREELGLARHKAASEVGISTEHLRRIEADSSRPSPEVLENILQLYEVEGPDAERVWLNMARSYIPEPVRRRVVVSSGSMVSELRETIVDAAVEWLELYYEAEDNDLKYLRAHIQSKLE